MTDDLERALEESNQMVTTALAEAKRELAELDGRRSHLVEMIDRAEALQRFRDPAAEPHTRLTLHDAMALVLREQGNRWMNIRDLADAINQRQLYRKKDGTRVEINQFHARINNYSQMFERNGPEVRLHDLSAVTR